MTDPRVTGASRYAEDVELPEQLHARIVRSLYPHARVLSVAVPDGVVALTPDDVRGLGRYGCQIQDSTLHGARPRSVTSGRERGAPVQASSRRKPSFMVTW